MLPRRLFVGCALCAASGFAAPEVSAQTPGFKRTILQQTDGPMPGYVTVVVKIDIEPGATVARHTHPGIESSYIVAGSSELFVDGQPSRQLTAGDAFQIPVATPHSVKNGDKPTTVAGTFVVEKGKPLASPA